MKKEDYYFGSLYLILLSHLGSRLVVELVLLSVVFFIIAMFKK